MTQMIGLLYLEFKLLNIKTNLEHSTLFCHVITFRLIDQDLKTICQNILTQFCFT